MIIGIPSMNFMCLVLCLTASIVRYIATDPPSEEIMSKVDSGVLHPFRFALILSLTVTITATRDMTAIYNKRYLIILIFPCALLCHFVASFVIGVTCVSFYPNKLHCVYTA